MNLVDELFKVTKALRDAGIEYAVCGGIAVTVHGYTRFTDDIDILILPTDVSRALEAVRPLGFDLAANPMTFGADTPKERHIQRVSKAEDGRLLTLDLLLAEAAYAGLLEGRRELPLASERITVVARDALLKMKRMAGRDQDLLDIKKLSGEE